MCKAQSKQNKYRKPSMHINPPSGLGAKTHNWKLHWSNPEGYNRGNMPAEMQNA